MPIPSRHREWPGLLNARTLAGIPTAFGLIGHGRLFRSDEPTGPLGALTDVLKEEGIRTLLDLRSARETERRPSPFASEAGYASAPLIDLQMEHLRDPAAEKTLLDLYRGNVDRNGRTIAEAVSRILRSPPGGVLVHCAVGKDRTGILIALILSALGTQDAVIVDDYTQSEPHLTGFFAEELAAIEDPVRRERVIWRRHATPETMSGLLNHIRSQYGDAGTYLQSHGLTHRDLRLLAGRFTSG
ncbi:tyrosine-protein phosphatase [soil metagenome]